MSQNGISTLSTKQLKQEAKLAAAALKRNSTSRPSTLVINDLPTKYTGNNVTDNPNVGGLRTGRPWT